MLLAFGLEVTFKFLIFKLEFIEICFILVYKVFYMRVLYYKYMGSTGVCELPRQTYLFRKWSMKSGPAAMKRREQ